MKFGTIVHFNEKTRMQKKIWKNSNHLWSYDCSAVFSALLKIQTRTHLLVIYVRCFMYLGLLVLFLHVIIAKFGQFNLCKAHYLASSCFSNSSNPIA